MIQIHVIRFNYILSASKAGLLNSHYRIKFVTRSTQVFVDVSRICLTLTVIFSGLM